ncbi:peptidylprolyl isomerase [Flavobacterium sp.]|uniref:peptidylprolyl isomerase n=1 Tax=Flavobacterium sp. TaxID=239 RepID=UPI0028BE4541|nr:peptidylprolyl isomerase [Flavobacterium sp.]
MKFKAVLLGLILASGVAANAQEIKKEVLFTIDDKPYYTDEFARVYRKNLDLVKDDSQKDLNQYLDLFIGYKLKVAKANKLGLQNGVAYQNELKSYRTQLSRNYTSDTKVTKELINEAYERSLKEVKASHILFNVDENAAPADTLKAYNQAMDVRKKALAGENFETLATQYSQDPSAKENKGNLGWFSVFRMVYPFESAAFKTSKGSISLPVRTRFGYHLVKVNDVRDNRGQVTVAHIMTLNGQNPVEAETAKKTIDEVYKKLKQGESFEALAQQFSQDKSSSGKGGALQRFGSGELSSEIFENTAFSLKDKEQISEPFQSEFGWHIIKLLEKHPVKPIEEVEAEFDSRIRKDDRSKLISKSLNDKLRAKYKVEQNKKAYNTCLLYLNDKFYTQEWEMPGVKDPQEVLFTINKDQKVKSTAFVTYMSNQQKANLNIKPLGKLYERLYNDFVDAKLAEYYDNNLEKEFPEFGHVMDEYRDGLLLFDLMEKEIWQKAKTDSLGLQQFYDLNKTKYQWKERVKANVFSSTKEDIIKKAQKFLKKGKSADYIKEQLNKNNKVEVMTNGGTFEVGSENLPKLNEYKKGISDIVKVGDYYYVVQIDETFAPAVKTLDEVRGRVINDYQQYLEQHWVEELKKEFSIKVNDATFAKVKNELK